ncbi:alpha/beta hydrolase fold-domain-containing protein [Sporodiniella umbellata]|nr:alpha/beta hydrolase fold-domain-containing protein [Sporodiniella umbellata]
MTKYPPIPLTPDLLQAVKSVLGVSEEEATQLDVYRNFTDMVSTPDKADEKFKEDLTAEVDSKKVKVSIIKPSGHNNEVLPVILYLHGGGWVFCNYVTFSKQMHQMANCANAYVVFPHYSLSPEAKYPVALEECYTTLQWMQKNSKSLKFDLSRLAVVGDSAGGNLAAALTLLCKQRNNKGIKQQVLYYPVTDSNFETSTYRQYTNSNGPNAKFMKYLWECYVRDEKDYHSSLVAPLKATDEELEGLPPALFVFAEIDALRDEGEAYAKKLRKAGVDILSVRYNQAVHGFVTFALPNISAAGIAAIQQTADWLKRRWLGDSKI